MDGRQLRISLGRIFSDSMRFTGRHAHVRGRETPEKLFGQELGNTLDSKALVGTYGADAVVYSF